MHAVGALRWVTIANARGHTDMRIHRSRVRKGSHRSTAVVRRPNKAPLLRREVKTMFLSLAAGTIMVAGSVAYDHAVSAQTRAFLVPQEISRDRILSHDAEPFTTMLLDLENQDMRAASLKPFPREYLKLRSEEEGLNYRLLDRIAYCESKWRMVKNSRSSAYGYFQIIDGTERLTNAYQEGHRKEDPYANIDMAIHLYEKYGTIPWASSRPCWAMYQ